MLHGFVQIIDALQFAFQRWHNHLEDIQQLLFSAQVGKKTKKNLINFVGNGISDF